MNELSLRLNKFDSLLLSSSNLLISDLYLCYELDLYYKNKEKEILVGRTSAGTFAEQFIRALSLAIEQKLPLHNSITHSLGYIIGMKFLLIEKMKKVLYMKRMDPLLIG